jgi:tetratricopeptide (TPR) repeat protein
MIAHQLRDLQGAETAYLKALETRESDHFSSVDLGIVSYKARHNLGLEYEAMGRADLAEVQWRNSRVNGSQFAPSRRAMIERMLQQRRLETARIEINGMLCASTLRCDGLLLDGMLQETLGNIQDATRCLKDAVKAFPDHEEPLQALCRLLFEHDQLPEAEIATQAILARNPHDAAAYHNLGAISLRQEKLTEAILAFRRSLELRPDAEMTKEQLDAALLALAHKE